MSNNLKIRFENQPSLVAEATQMLENANIDYFTTAVRGTPPVPDIVVVLGTTGTLASLYQIIRKVLEKNKNRKVTIEQKDSKFSFTGYSLPEIAQFLDQLSLPESGVLKKNSQNDAKSDNFSIKESLVTQFNTVELMEICFDLKVDYDDLQGGEKKEKAIELIKYMERRNRTMELVELIRQLRPNIS